ncbi:MAG: TIGR02391 family protein [Erysipelotrichaceae bacterium]
MPNNGVTNLRELVSKDIWNVIKNNYENKSYTAAIMNLMLYINEIIQDKSNLENIDNTALIEKAFFGNNPKLQINKLQTQTEKNIQLGIGHLFKGACFVIRNPRAHERYDDEKLTADRIILFYDYLLSFVINSSEPRLVNDWIKFILDNNFVTSEQYAEETFNLIPQKKRYDILVSIFRENECTSNNKLYYIVEKLINSLTKEEYKTFMDGLNQELTYCKNDSKLSMFFNLFPITHWNDLCQLSKLRIENIVMQSINNACIEYDDFGGYDSNYSVSLEGMLAVNALDHIPTFETFEDIKKAINRNYKKDKELRIQYFEKYFNKYLEIDSSNNFNNNESSSIPF